MGGQFENIDGKLYCNNIDSYGYYVGTNSKPSTFDIESSIIRRKKGYSNKLYYPYLSGYNGTYGYWIASTRANSSSYLRIIYYDGAVKICQCNLSSNGIRPVVSLNTGVTVNATDEE